MTRTLNTRRLFGENGRAYAATFIGTPVLHTTHDGTARTGTLTHFVSEGNIPYPVVTFPDGRWARLNHTITLAA